MTQLINSDDDVENAWDSDLSGSKINRDGIMMLRKTLNQYRLNPRTHIMATFVPDKVIHVADLSLKSFRKFIAVLLLIDIKHLFGFYENHYNGRNGGSCRFIEILNKFMTVAIEAIYSSGGDILKISTEVILAMWDVPGDMFIFQIVHDVILCAQSVQRQILSLKSETSTPRVNMVISSGNVLFSTIGNDTARHWILLGQPIDDLKNTNKFRSCCDLILTSSAWEHCSPSNYEYVILDSNSFKIIKTLGSPVVSIKARMDLIASAEKGLQIIPEETSLSTSLFNSTRIFKFDSGYKFGLLLRSYLIEPILQKIDNKESLDHLTESRQLTFVSIDVVPKKCSIHELVSLVDEIFLVLLKISNERSGYINTINVCEKNVLFCVAHGLPGYIHKFYRTVSSAKMGILSAIMIMRSLKLVDGIKEISIGVSTGIAFCGVIGCSIRRRYIILGEPVSKALEIMRISSGKISCDYDTVLYSRLKKKNFWSRGIKTLNKLGKFHVYVLIEKSPRIESIEQLSNLNYPILGRVKELKRFKDVLDDIGVSGRNFSGILIQGSERMGKSRLLDAFVTIVRNKSIKLLQLTLYLSNTGINYTALHQILIQLLNAEDCLTIDDRERILLDKLNGIIEIDDFCYLNSIMRVQFPLSKEYCSDSDWKRYSKTIKIVETILNKVGRKMCILLDDVQYIDAMSWQFLVHFLKNQNIVFAMTMQEPNFIEDLSPIVSEISKHKNLMKQTLNGLEPKYLAAFACQLLNVLAIPKTLEKVLKSHSENSLIWCETFLTMALQMEALIVTDISFGEAKSYDLVFPDSSLIKKVPSFLSSNELTRPLYWTRMAVLRVCIMKQQCINFSDILPDITGMRNVIYDGMELDEREFLKCAATFGKIFKRDMVEDLMRDLSPLRTAEIIAKLVRIRILACAMIQRKGLDRDDESFAIFQKRNNFGDVNYSLTCECMKSSKSSSKLTEQERKSLPIYAHCRMLEFTSSSYRRVFYDMILFNEKKEYHTNTANKLEKYAKKCSTCGGGRFLNVASRKPYLDQRSSGNRLMRRRAANLRRLDQSVLTEIGIYSTYNEMHQALIDRSYRSSILSEPRISVLPSFEDVEDSDEEFENDCKIKKNIFYDEKLLKKFSHIDYRNCRCIDVISFLYSMLHEQILSTGDPNKMITFTMEYGAGLLQTGQPSYAVNLLTKALARTEIQNQLSESTEDMIINKGVFLVLLGDAYLALGNFYSAKNMYTLAMKLHTIPMKGTKGTYFSSIIEKLRHNLLRFPDNILNKISGQSTELRFELASYLRRLSLISMIEHKPSIAKLNTLYSLKFGVECAGGFQEKGEIFLTAMQIFRWLGKNQLIESLELPILSIVREKSLWNMAEEMLQLANIFQTIYEIRILKGDLLAAIDIGNKILKICSTLRITRVQLSILPSLIEIMVWTQHIHESVDLIKELYFLAEEDIDESSITWYYALCLELLLDAGMFLEPYEICYRHYKNITAYQKENSVSRDPKSLFRLITCIGIWQIRSTSLVGEAFVIQNIDKYIANIKCDSNKFSQIFNCCKGLECYLLILLFRANMKKSNKLLDQMRTAERIVNILIKLSKTAMFLKPFIYLIRSHVDMIKDRKLAAKRSMQKSKKWSRSQNNKLIFAWLIQNSQAWKEKNYRNMVQYWIKYVGTGNAIHWQDIHSITLQAWSTILLPFPVPDSNSS